MKSYLALAYRNLWRHPRRTILNIVAIAICVTAMTGFLCMFRGSGNDAIMNTIRMEVGHFQYTRPGYQEVKRRAPLDLAIEDYRGVGADIFESDHQTDDLAYIEYSLVFQGLVSNGRKTFGVSAAGILKEGPDASTLERAVGGRDDGDAGGGGLFSAQDAHEIIIGVELARVLDVGVGDTISLLAQTTFEESNFDYFEIAGIFEIGFYEMDRNFVYLPLETAQYFLDMSGRATHILVMLRGYLREFWRFQPALRAIADARALEGRNWMELKPSLMNDLKADMVFMSIFALVLIFLSAMGVANTTHMAVFERKREIGTMRALGARGRVVGRVLAAELVIMSTIGILAGFALVVPINLWLIRTGISYEAFTDLLQTIQLPVSTHLYGQTEWYDYPLTAVVMWLATLAGGLAPIRKILKLNIRESLSEKI